MLAALIIFSGLNALIFLLMGWLGAQPVPEYKKRTYKIWFKRLAGVGVVTIIAVGILTYKVEQRAEQRRKDAERRAEEAEKTQKELRSQMDKVSKHLAFFETIAKKRFPNLPPSEALEKLQNEMQQLETRTSKLEQKTAFRKLSLSQKNALINSLSPYKGHKIHIQTIGDVEARQFAEAFKEVFEQAGWIVSGFGLMIYQVQPVGIIIKIGKYPSSVGEIIYDAFQAVGLQVQGKVNPSFKSDDVVLIIGSKI